MSYAVKSIFYTLQGEGAQAGRPAVFCRFSGCNLWNGREEDRSSAVCTFCDTDFVGTDGPGGGKYASAGELAQAIAAGWPAGGGGKPYVVFTGGEPLLQLDDELIAELKSRGFSVALETNGTLPAPESLDWITVSPKAGAELVQRKGNELKVVYPQAALDPADLARLDFEHFFLSPLNAPLPAETEENTRLSLAYCLEHPQWKLTMQHHKYWRIP